MGVEYGASSGFGFLVPVEELEELSHNTEFEESEYGFEDDEFGWWLVQDNPYLTYEIVGDHMKGENLSLAIVAKSTLTEVSHFGYESYVKKLPREGGSVGERFALASLFIKLFNRDPEEEDIGWYVATTVS